MAIRFGQAARSTAATAIAAIMGLQRHHAAAAAYLALVVAASGTVYATQTTTDDPVIAGYTAGTAYKLRYNAPASSADIPPLTSIITIAGYTLKARCVLSLSTPQLQVFGRSTRSGTLEWSLIQSTNDNKRETFALTGGKNHPSGTDVKSSRSPDLPLSRRSPAGQARSSSSASAGTHSGVLSWKSISTLSRMTAARATRPVFCTAPSRQGLRSTGTEWSGPASTTPAFPNRATAWQLNTRGLGSPVSLG